MSRVTAGERVAMWRKLRGKTQKDLAAAVGLTESTLSRIETNHVSIDAVLLERIAKEFGLTMGAFYGETAPSRRRVSRAS